MSLPIAANTTCDVYRSGNAPPAAPDVAGVPGHLKGSFERRMEAGEGMAKEYRFTHTLLVETAADVRDGMTTGYASGAADTVYIPDQNGTPFRVVFAERVGRGTALDHRRVYLDRGTPSWPTENV